MDKKKQFSSLSTQPSALSTQHEPLRHDAGISLQCKGLNGSYGAIPNEPQETTSPLDI